MDLTISNFFKVISKIDYFQDMLNTMIIVKLSSLFSKHFKIFFNFIVHFSNFSISFYLAGNKQNNF